VRSPTDRWGATRRGWCQDSHTVTYAFLTNSTNERPDRRGVMAIFAEVISDRLPAPGLEPSILPLEGQSEFVAEAA